MNVSASGPPAPLAGLRVLVVEDDDLISMLFRDMLEELGCAVVGPAGTIPTATALAEIEALDAAMLDVNLAGQPVFPVAQILARRQVPILFVTGYGAAGLPPAWATRPSLQKPCRIDQLALALLETLSIGA